MFQLIKNNCVSLRWLISIIYTVINRRLYKGMRVLSD